MQNKQQISEKILDMIWRLMSTFRGSMPHEDIRILIITTLYAYHKGYPLIKEGDIELKTNNDALYNDLIKASTIRNSANDVIYSLYRALEKIDRNHFNTIYAEVLKGLFDRWSSTVESITNEFYTPKEITKLMSYIIKKEDCTSIYDPFCGTASITHELSDENSNIQFIGQEINQRIALYARVNLEAACGTHGEILVGDSTKQWNSQEYDAIVTCPPFNLILDEEDRRMTFKSLPHDFRYMESIVLTAPFYINKAKLSVVLAPKSLCFRGGIARGIRNRSISDSNYILRRYLIDNNLLDTIIALPSSMLYGTSIPSVILICKNNRKRDEAITFVHAEEYYHGERFERTLDVDRLINMMTTTRHNCVAVRQDEVRNNDYNLNPALYIKKDLDLTLKEGQQVVCLSDLITPIEGELIFTDDDSDPISIPQLGDNFIEILLNNSKVSPWSGSRNPHRYRHFEASSRKYLLTLQVDFESHTGSFKNKFGLFTDSKSFNCPIGWKVYEVNESAVTPEYLAYILVNNKALTNNETSLAHYMSVQIVIDRLEKQKEIVNRIKQEYSAKVNAEREAEAQRLGIKQNISDLEHMLGSTQFRIAKIIERLECATPETANYPQIVKQLKDNVEYMNRVIQYSNASIDQNSINKQADDFVEYINTYVDGWRNYGNNCFDLSIVNDLIEAPLITFDRDMLTVMLDSVLNNAARHGFNKRKVNGNNVLLRLSIVEHESRPHLLISIANNGDAMADGFTINDYISRGRYTTSTGRSGLGGYHIYQIIKGHGGFLCLDSNKQWSVIVDILLPIDSVNTNDITTYEHECI